MDRRSSTWADSRWDAIGGSGVTRSVRAGSESPRTAAVARVRPLRVCVDPGHGMSNRKAGFYDPGAVGIGGAEEAEIVLRWGHALAGALEKAGAAVVMTRWDPTTPTPLGNRVKTAMEAEADLLVSLHLNAFRDPKANGVETLHSSHGTSLELAKAVHPHLVKSLGLRDRGLKVRDDLAVLKFTPSVLIELGFVTNRGDLGIVSDGSVMVRTCRVLAGALVVYSDDWHLGGREG